MNAWETGLASMLLPCPHCGKAPQVEAITYEDKRADGLDVEFLRPMRLGKTYHRIECRTVLEGVDWDDMRETWNRRGDSQKVKLQEGMARNPKGCGP